MNGIGVGLEQRHELFRFLRLERTELFEPRAASVVALVDASGDGVAHCLENRPRIPDQAERHVAILADRAVVHIDLYDGGVSAQALAIAHAEIERCADDHDDVGFVESVSAGAMEVVWISRRQQTAAGSVEVGRDVELSHEIDGGLVAAAAPHLCAQQDGRSLRSNQQIGQLFDVVRVAD